MCGRCTTSPRQVLLECLGNNCICAHFLEGSVFFTQRDNQGIEAQCATCFPCSRARVQPRFRERGCFPPLQEAHVYACLLHVSGSLRIAWDHPGFWWKYTLMRPWDAHAEPLRTTQETKPCHFSQGLNSAVVYIKKRCDHLCRDPAGTSQKMGYGVQFSYRDARYFRRCRPEVTGRLLQSKFPIRCFGGFCRGDNCVFSGRNCCPESAYKGVEAEKAENLRFLLLYFGWFCCGLSLVKRIILWENAELVKYDESKHYWPMQFNGWNWTFGCYLSA